MCAIHYTATQTSTEFCRQHYNTTLWQTTQCTHTVTNTETAASVQVLQKSSNRYYNIYQLLMLLFLFAWYCIYLWSILLYSIRWHLPLWVLFTFISILSFYYKNIKNYAQDEILRNIFIIFHDLFNQNRNIKMNYTILQFTIIQLIIQK